MTTFPIFLIGALAFAWTLAHNPHSPIPAGFVLVALLPVLAASTWLHAERTGRSWSTWLGVLSVVGAGVLLAVRSGFSLCHPATASLRCAAFLGTCWFGVLGWSRLVDAFRVPKAVTVVTWVLPWALLVTAPFFAVSLTTAWFPDLSGHDVAQTIVTLHPLSALCDALGGVDAFREGRLYAEAEIGAHYAYRLPGVFGHVAVYGALALAGAFVEFLRRRRAEDRTPAVEVGTSPSPRREHP